MDVVTKGCVRMKKQKLGLNRETVRHLDGGVTQAELRRAGGGNSWDNSVCPGCIDYPTQSPTNC
jgi:hypothetical protein